MRRFFDPSAKTVSRGFLWNLINFLAGFLVAWLIWQATADYILALAFSA